MFLGAYLPAPRVSDRSGVIDNRWVGRTPLSDPQSNRQSVGGVLRPLRRPQR